MADFSTLISRIKAAIKPNGAGQITGQVMQDALVKTGEGIVQELGTAITENETAIARKQDTLVSGTNIKTVGGISLLGGGDVQTYVHVMKFEGDPSPVFVDGLNEALEGRFVMDGQVYQNFKDFCRALQPGHVILQLDTNEHTPYGNHDKFANLSIFIVMGSDPDAEADGAAGPELYLKKLYPEDSPVVKTPVDWDTIVQNYGGGSMHPASEVFTVGEGGEAFLTWLNSYCDADTCNMMSDKLNGQTYPTTSGQTMTFVDEGVQNSVTIQVSADGDYQLQYNICSGDTYIERL